MSLAVTVLSSWAASEFTSTKLLSISAWFLSVIFFFFSCKSWLQPLILKALLPFFFYTLPFDKTLLLLTAWRSPAKTQSPLWNHYLGNYSLTPSATTANTVKVAWYWTFKEMMVNPDSFGCWNVNQSFWPSWLHKMFPSDSDDPL